jgi:hypothetical protein
MMVLAFHWHQPIDGGCAVHQHFNIMLPTWDLELNTLGARQPRLATAASRCLTCKASFFFGLVGLQDGQRVTKAYIPYLFHCCSCLLARTQRRGFMFLTCCDLCCWVSFAVACAMLSSWSACCEAERWTEDL